MAKQKKSFNILAGLFRRYSDNAKGLPAQTDIVPTRTVVCFSLLGANLAVGLEEISELLELPSCTHLPRVKSWVRGVANVRGRLLPVINFAEFLGGGLKMPPKSQRVLVIDALGIFVGLIVDQVQGMRHFKVDTYRRELGEVPEVLAPYIEGSFIHEGEEWMLFRPSQLLQDHCFMEVAA